MAKSKPLTPAEFAIHLEARTDTQQQVIDLWPQSRVLFLLGPAGVGKDYLALGLALQEILHGRHEKGKRPRLLLTRPMVAVDEELGFLPGNVDEKTEPWLLPFKDVLRDLSFDSWEQMRSAIEVEYVPIGMLRGRTVANAILIGDELQNASAAQIKCLLTRIGRNGRLVLCADPEQSDLFTDYRTVPIVEAAAKLVNLDAVSVIRFTRDDVIRDPLVSAILDKLDPVKTPKTRKQ